MRKEEMPTIFADQIKMQNKGSIIGPFRSGVGFHILKIEDVKGEPKNSQVLTLRCFLGGSFCESNTIFCA